MQFIIPVPIPKVWEWAEPFPFPFPNVQKSFPLTPGSNISKNERKSNILLVEVNGDAYVDPHNKKGDTGQDHGL